MSETVVVSLGGQTVPVLIEGGNLGIGASVLVGDLNVAVGEAAASADAAQAAAQSAQTAVSGRALVDLSNASAAAVAVIGATNTSRAVTNAFSPIFNVSASYAALGYGNSAKSSNVQYFDTSFAHAGESEFGNFSTVVSTGSGANGPSNATIAQGYAVYQRNWQFSKILSEMDVSYKLFAKGLLGDVGGDLFDGSKIIAIAGDATLPEGGMTPIEISSKGLKCTNTTTKATTIIYSVQSIPGLLENYDGIQIQPFGNYMEARVGVTFAGYHWGARDDSAGQEGAAPSVLWGLYGESKRPVSPEARTLYQVFGVTGDGTRIQMGPAANRIHIRVAGGVLQFRNAANSATTASLGMDGTVTASNNLIASGGLVTHANGFTVAQLNSLLGSVANGTTAYCTNGLAGQECLAFRRTSGWVVAGTNTAISAT